MIWLNINCQSIHQLLYDKTMCVPINNCTEACQLITKAIIVLLTLQNQQQL